MVDTVPAVVVAIVPAVVGRAVDAPVAVAPVVGRAAVAVLAAHSRNRKTMGPRKSRASKYRG